MPATECMYIKRSSAFVKIYLGNRHADREMEYGATLITVKVCACVLWKDRLGSAAWASGGEIRLSGEGNT